MACLIEQALPCRLPPRRLSPFESLIKSVIYQQLSGKAAGTILGRFQALFVREGFPTPRQVARAPLEKLRSAGLSGAKSRYVQDIARRTLAGRMPTLEECDGMSDDELIRTLTETKGVGRWTVEMFLIFNLGRSDVLPAHDLGVRKGFQIAYRKRKMPEPEQLLRFGKRWIPHRTTATWYLWRAADPEFVFAR